MSWMFEDQDEVATYCYDAVSDFYKFILCVCLISWRKSSALSVFMPESAFGHMDMETVLVLSDLSAATPQDGETSKW